MSMIAFPVSVCAAGSDFTITNGVLTKYAGAGGGVVIPFGVRTIGKNAFERCAEVTSVTVPNSVTSIERMALYFGQTTGLTC